MVGPKRYVLERESEDPYKALGFGDQKEYSGHLSHLSCCDMTVRHGRMRTGINLGLGRSYLAFLRLLTG